MAIGIQRTLFNCGRTAANGSDKVSVTLEDGALKIKTPYSRTFVDRLKFEIPATARNYKFEEKVWMVSVKFAAQVKAIIDDCYSVNVAMPDISSDNSQIFQTTIKCDYVANCKGDAASVWCDNGWTVKITTNALRTWFKQTEANDGTFYGVLGCDQTASSEEIKKAYKRAARTWHPDICREPNAREKFEEIKAAYEILNNPESRAKYNAGLFFEKIANSGKEFTGNGSRFAPPSFVPLLRCGELVVKARKDLGMLIVEEILEWRDIQNAIGQTMVSFWSGDSFVAMWV